MPSPTGPTLVSVTATVKHASETLSSEGGIERIEVEYIVQGAANAFDAKSATGIPHAAGGEIIGAAYPGHPELIAQQMSVSVDEKSMNTAPVYHLKVLYAAPGYTNTYDPPARPVYTFTGGLSGERIETSVFGRLIGQPNFYHSGSTTPLTLRDEAADIGVDGAIPVMELEIRRPIPQPELSLIQSAALAGKANSQPLVLAGIALPRGTCLHHTPIAEEVGLDPLGSRQYAITERFTIGSRTLPTGIPIKFEDNSTWSGGQLPVGYSIKPKFRAYNFENTEISQAMVDAAEAPGATQEAVKKATPVRRVPFEIIVYQHVEQADLAPIVDA